MHLVRIGIRIGIRSRRRIPHGVEAVVTNIERRCAAHEGPGRLVGLGELPRRERSDLLSVRHMKRRVRRSVRRFNAGETLPHALALLAGWIAAEIIFVFYPGFRKLAALLPRKSQQLLRFGAVLILGIFQNFRQDLDRTSEIVLVQRRPRFVRPAGNRPQVRVGNLARRPVFRAEVRGAVTEWSGRETRPCREYRLALRRWLCAGDCDHDALGIGVRGDLIGNRVIEKNPEHGTGRILGLEVDRLDPVTLAVGHRRCFAPQCHQGGRLVAIDRIYRDPQFIAPVERKMARIANADIERDLENRAALLDGNLRI